VRRRSLDEEQREQRTGSAPEKDHDLTAAVAGASAGMPRFLSEVAPGTAADEEPPAQAVQELMADPAAEVDDAEPAAVPDVSGEGPETEARAYSVTLRGLTEADFSSSFKTRNVRTAAGSGCENCAGDDCVHTTGILVSTFRVTTTVTLPSVDDFPDLTPCQRRRVQNGITNVLAPHEQEHVAAFNTYRGTVRTPFDLTLCRADFDASIQELHDSVEAARRTVAQDASDALDPFSFDVDLDCED
jgi:hypothetical protein